MLPGPFTDKHTHWYVRGDDVKTLRMCSVAAILVLATTVSVPYAALAQQPLPNLFLDPLTFVNAGKDERGHCMVKVRLIIFNKGAGKAGAFSTGLEVASNVFTYAQPNGLPAFSSTIVVQDVVVAPGSYLVKAKTDVFDQVVETVEADNSRTAQLVCATEPR